MRHPKLARFFFTGSALLASLLSGRSALADEPGAPVTLPPAGAEAAPVAQPAQGRMRRITGEDETRATPTLVSSDGFPLVGYHRGRFYVRDASDKFRLFPGGLLQVDGRAALGRGVDEVLGDEGRTVRPRFGVRRARLDLGGQVLDRWSFFVSGDFAGKAPHLEHALVDVNFHRLLRLSVGQQLIPFSLDNRTFEPSLVWMERSLPVRFALPYDKDVGAMLWGETDRAVLMYEAGVFGGDGPNRTGEDSRVDFAGRVRVRPLGATESFVRNLAFGASAYVGMREASKVGYQLEPITTDGGFSFFRTSYVDQGKAVKIIPSGRQMAFGGELRVPVSKLDLRFEFVWVKRSTREAIEGRELSGQSERFGHLVGSAASGHVGVWLLGDSGLLREVGRFRPPSIRFPQNEAKRPDRGLLAMVKVDTISFTYDPSDRTPGGLPAAQEAYAIRPAQEVWATGVGAGLNYYATRHAALMLQYTYYVFPQSGVPGTGPANAAVAPGNVTGHTGAHQMHELGARMQVFF